MARTILLPPTANAQPDGAMPGGWWHDAETEGRIVCDLCPRGCNLKPGDRGFWFVRENRDGQMLLTTYGRSTGFCIDPIEKKPLNHFYPGTSVLSFGTAGCNLGCKFCQNWDISKSRQVERLSEEALPDTIAQAARQLGCHSVAYTYNDPVIWAEYAIDTAKACKAAGIQSVAVTAGYINPTARETFFQYMDAANVDLKAFTEDFYFKLTYSHLQPVLDTLRWIKEETNVWLEITNLVIPGENDNSDDLRRLCDWVLEAVGADVPLHFSAFHPDFRMTDKPRTPVETLLLARETALQQGIRFAYVGNVDDVRHQSTYCPSCQQLLIERNWYVLGTYQLQENRCGHCGAKIAGRFQSKPGTWGQRRQPVRIAQFAAPGTSTNRKDTQMTDTPSGTSTSAPVAVPNSPELNDDQRISIHRAACEVVKCGVCGQQTRISDPRLAEAADQTVMGAFVTLKRKGQLRACCGTLGRPMPLGHALQHAALRTATEDTRFPTISPTELPHLHLDVTLLYGFQPVQATGRDRIQEIEIGRHGLQIQRGNQAGLLLPSVATENGWNAEEFLQHVCRKAGLPTTAWLSDDTKLLKFEGHMIPGDFLPELLESEIAEPAGMFTPEQLRSLADACCANVVALTRGATPNYYLPGCADGTVQAANIAVQIMEGREPLQLSQLSLRPGLPLQATLFKLAEAAANVLKRQQVSIDQLTKIGLDLTVLYDPAMHGTLAQADIADVDLRRRAIMVHEHGKNAWRFDPQASPATLVAQLAEEAQVVSREMTSVFSLSAQSTASQAGGCSVPKAARGNQVRPPAVAGTFYPAKADELATMLDEMLDASDATPEPWPAVMVPHAGLVYSGRLAAATLKHVEFPETILLIGPKHTRYGVEWAVAPHKTWSLPGMSIESDPDLAKQLADAIPNLQLDAAAHANEHSLEVQLPFLARLAPNSRVIGIAIGAADLNACRDFATGLAAVLKELPQMPLIIASTDMNHFANDEENRRLDEIALEALETLDSATVYDVVVAQYSISMCGVRPVLIAMETLRQLGKLSKCQRVGYATSADVSGDKNRVVGYAGMLFG